MASSHKGNLEEASKVAKCVMKSELMQEEAVKEMMIDHFKPTAMPKGTTVREETTERIATMVKVAQVSHEREPIEIEKVVMTRVTKDEEDQKGKNVLRDIVIVAKRKEFLEWMITRTLIMQKRMPLLTSKLQAVLRREDVWVIPMVHLEATIQATKINMNTERPNPHQTSKVNSLSSNPSPLVVKGILLRRICNISQVKHNSSTERLNEIEFPTTHCKRQRFAFDNAELDLN